MALHLLLFTSDAQIALTLGKLLSEFDIEVEFCSEALASVEKVTRDNFDAIVVDWDDGPEATFLLKTARELKSTRECLALALVSDAAAGACAVQIGAHGILNKPIVPEQIRENMRTIREMILSRQSSAKAAAQPAQPAISSVLNAPPVGEEEPPQEDKAQKESPDTREDPKLRFLAREPRDLPSLPPMPKTLEPPPREASIGTIFSPPTLYQDELRETKPPAKRKRKGGTRRILVMSGVLFAAALLYVWAPGSSYFDRFTGLAKSLLNRQEPQKVNIEAKPSPSTAQSTNIEVTPQPSENQPPLPADAPPNDDSAANILVTPVTEPTDVNTGAPHSAQPTGPVGVTQPEDAQPVVAAPAPQVVAVPAPQVVAVPAPQVVASVQPPAPPARPTTIAAVDHSSVEVPQSLKFSNPINPVQTAATSAPPVQTGGSALNPVVVPEDTMKDLLIKKTPPAYPEPALKAGLQGAVVLQAWIAKDGSVRDVKLLRGPFVLARAAVDAVKQWQYKPYSLNGQALDVQTQITVNFRIPGGATTVAMPASHPVTGGVDSSKQ